MEGQGIVFGNEKLQLVMDNGAQIVPFRLCVSKGEMTIRTNISKGSHGEDAALKFLATLASDLKSAGLNVETLTRKTMNVQRIDCVTIKSG